MTHALPMQSGEPTTPTPYPDGLIVHHADGSVEYPEAYTGSIPAQPVDAWYQRLGFYHEPADEHFDGWWEWFGMNFLDWENVEPLGSILMYAFAWVGTLFAFIYWAKRDLLPLAAGILAWSGLLLSALILFSWDEDGPFFTQLLIPIASLSLFLARPAKSRRWAYARYAMLTAALGFPDAILAVLGADIWWNGSFMYACMGWIALAPLALRIESQAESLRTLDIRHRALLLAGLLPPALTQLDSITGSYVLRYIHIVIAAVSILTWGALVRSRAVHKAEVAVG